MTIRESTNPLYHAFYWHLLHTNFSCAHAEPCTAIQTLTTAAAAAAATATATAFCSLPAMDREMMYYFQSWENNDSKSDTWWAPSWFVYFSFCGECHVRCHRYFHIGHISTFSRVNWLIRLLISFMNKKINSFFFFRWIPSFKNNSGTSWFMKKSWALELHYCCFEIALKSALGPRSSTHSTLNGWKIDPRDLNQELGNWRLCLIYSCVDRFLIRAQGPWCQKWQRAVVGHSLLVPFISP